MAKFQAGSCRTSPRQICRAFCPQRGEAQAEGITTGATAVQIWTLRGVILGGSSQGTTMRGLVIVGVLCLTSMPALACVFDTDCKPGFSCRNGACSGIEMNSGDVKPSVPKERVKGAKYCTYDSDCGEGSRCIKGSLLEGVCLGR